MSDIYKYETLTALSIPEEIRIKAEQYTPTDLHIELHRQENVNTYLKRLDFAERNPNAHIINIKETKRLLNLWNEMEGKSWNQLTTEQKNEVLDSMISSGYYGQSQTIITPRHIGKER